MIRDDDTSQDEEDFSVISDDDEDEVISLSDDDEEEYDVNIKSGESDSFNMNISDNQEDGMNKETSSRIQRNVQKNIKQETKEVQPTQKNIKQGIKEDKNKKVKKQQHTLKAQRQMPQLQATPYGFHFLLQSTASQVWTLFNAYVKSPQFKDSERVDVFCILCQILHHSHVAVPLSLNPQQSQYSEIHQTLKTKQFQDGKLDDQIIINITAQNHPQLTAQILNDLADLGLIYLFRQNRMGGAQIQSSSTSPLFDNNNDFIFLVTPLVAFLREDENAIGDVMGNLLREIQEDNEEEEQYGELDKYRSEQLIKNENSSQDIIQTSSSSSLGGFIVVEPNYRIYAYTSSVLHLQLLLLFCNIHFRLPNLIVATLTRESVHQAMLRNITGEQIVKFLEDHLHPSCRKPGQLIPSLPDTVRNQIFIWKRERERFTATPSVAFGPFTSESLFEHAKAAALNGNKHLWSGVTFQQGMMLIVGEDGSEELAHQINDQLIREKLSAMTGYR
ncbi:MAG: putative General transcription factor IIH subunit 4 [Streblomastix strix]|uniref:General transcription factor IIH subunit 4 n=1 Tax=Streblomastix strix TaxID=222440 RepID=A0A5J4WC18_9EUKA|nr:MAG: putative General transcription factor IIH subunit 4 [Streblomastix strix]